MQYILKQSWQLLHYLTFRDMSSILKKGNLWKFEKLICISSVVLGPISVNRVGDVTWDKANGQTFYIMVWCGLGSRWAPHDQGPSYLQKCKWWGDNFCFEDNSSFLNRVTKPLWFDYLWPQWSTTQFLHDSPYHRQSWSIILCVHKEHWFLYILDLLTPILAFLH